MHELAHQWFGDRLTVETWQHIALAEAVSGMALDELFDTWLFAPEKPVLD